MKAIIKIPIVPTIKRVKAEKYALTAMITKTNIEKPSSKNLNPRYIYLLDKICLIKHITKFPDNVAIAAPILLNCGIKIKFNPTFTTAPNNVETNTTFVFLLAVKTEPRNVASP